MGRRAAALVAVFAAVVVPLLAVAPAQAAASETVVDVPASSGKFTCQSESFREYGQSFTAPASGWLTRVGLYVANWSDESPARTVSTAVRILTGDGLSGAPLAGPQTVSWNLQGPDPVLQMVDLTTPVPVTEGQSYTIGSRQWCADLLAYGAAASPYPGGSGYIDAFSQDDLGFRAVIASTVYEFSGFDSPVDTGVVNVAKAGRTIPFKFRVTDPFGQPVTDLTTVRVTAVQHACGSSTGATDPLEQYAAGASGLQNLGDGNYQFNLGSAKAWAGTCRTLGVDLGDHVARTADFQFTR